jgi:hypothetical protein
MTVQELINRLSKVEDKTKDVVLCYEYGNLESGEPIGLEDVTEFQDSVVIG